MREMIEIRLQILRQELLMGQSRLLELDRRRLS